MKKRILAYLDYVDKLLERDDADWDTEIKLHLEQIGFFMHERLVHLIVTMTFAIMTVISFFMLITAPSLPALLLALLFLGLTIPYIYHYYFLENTVQLLYKDYDAIYKKVHGFSQEDMK
jgi:hypothetical protein